MIGFKNKPKIWILHLFMSVVALSISACSTMKRSENDDGPKPLYVISKNDAEKMVWSMWGESSPDALRSSTFSAAERYHIFSNIAVYYSVAAPENRNPCSTVKLISTRPVSPAPNDGSKSEIWVVEKCTVRSEFEATLTAADLAFIKAHPHVGEPVL
jgi:hypothetical protein